MMIHLHPGSSSNITISTPVLIWKQESRTCLPSPLMLKQVSKLRGARIDANIATVTLTGVIEWGS